MYDTGKNAGSGIGISPRLNEAQCQPTPERPSEIAGQLNLWMNEIDSLEKSLHRLSSRVALITLPSKSATNEQTCRPAPNVSTDFAKVMQNNNTRLYNLIEMLDDITNRIDL